MSGLKDPMLLKGNSGDNEALKSAVSGASDLDEKGIPDDKLKTYVQKVYAHIVVMTLVILVWVVIVFTHVCDNIGT